MTSWGTSVPQPILEEEKVADPRYNPQARQWVDDNTQLNFEKRILNPSQYPTLQNEDGSYSTHQMAWGDSDGKFFAYPTIVQQGNQLIRLPDALAFQHAMESGEYRMFSTPEDADAYASGGYKDSWGRGELPKK